MPHAKIKTHQAKQTLDQLHAELAGKIIDNEKEALKLVEQMKHVEAVLKLMDPDYNVQRLAVRRRKPNQYFKRGTVFRSAVDALRRSGQPMTVAETVNAMLASKGVTDATPAAVRSLWGAVQASLDNHKNKTVERVGEGMPSRWRLISNS